MGWKNRVTPEIFEGCLSTLGKLKVAWVRGVWVKIPGFFSDWIITPGARESCWNSKIPLFSYLWKIGGSMKGCAKMASL